MQAIIPTLKPGEIGPAAANLVEAVLLLVERGFIRSLDKANTSAAELAETARVELSISTFGVATRQLVVYFQLEQDLGDTLRGVVEEETADRLNRRLKELGVLEQPLTDEIAVKSVNEDKKGRDVEFLVRGSVTYANSLPASALKVKVFEVGLCRKEFLKDTSTSSSGTYEVRYSLGRADSIDTNTIGLLVEVHGPSERMIAASAIQYGLASTRTIDLVLPDSERGPSEYERYMASIQPILRDVPLGQLPCGEDHQPVAYLAGASGVPRDRVEMIVAAEQMADIDGNTGAKSSASAKKGLSSHRADANLFTSTMFYAWMRLGEPREREQILADRPDKLIRILKKAGEDNLIPALLDTDLKAIESALLATHTVHVLQPATNGARASLGDAFNLLTGSDALSDDQRRVIAQLTLQQTSGPDAEERLKEAKLTPTQMGSLRQIAALGQLSDGDAPLLQAARRHVLGKSETTTSFPLHAIAGLEESDWQQIVKAAKPDVTDSIEVGKSARRIFERTAQLLPNAFLLSRAMRQPDGTQLRTDLGEVAKLEQNNKDHGFKPRFDELMVDAIAPRDRRNVHASFDRMKELVNRYPGLELDAVLAGKENIADKAAEIQRRVGLIGSLVTANPDTEFLALDYVPDSPDLKALKFTGLQDSEKAMVLRTMKAHWRSFRIAGGALKAQRLMEAGFHSATVTAGTTLEEFISATNLSVAEAAAIHAEASDSALDVGLKFMAINSLLQPLGGTVHPLQSSFTPPSSHPIHSTTPPPEIVNHLKRFDGFKNLFGAQAICRCQHCRSVLGPAAYFVDLMRFIDKNITELVFDNNPQADQTLRLRYRRPDLWVLPLTCENADTLIPTLDIVNEILENFIDGRQTPTESQRSQIQKAVYLQLAEAKASFAQPYVLPLRQVEAYLEHFQLTRAQIAGTLELDADTTARAWLGISLAERDLIVNVGANAQLDKLFGVGITASTSADTQLFLTLSTWTRDELGQLLKTQFVQAGNAITIEPGKASAESVQNDREVVNGYSRPALDRLHRFTRLWLAIRRSEQWSIPELDLVLSSLASTGVAPTVTSPMLVDLAHLLEIQKRFVISVEQLCALIVDIPRTNLGTQRPFFDRLFNLDSFVVQDGLWPAVAPPMFQHPSSLPAAASASSVLSNGKLSQRLMAGSQISDQELVQLLEGLKWFTNAVSLDLQNLTLIYRHALLARTLKVSIPDLFQLLALGNVPNARVSNLVELLQLVKIVDDWRETGVSMDDITVITGGTPSDPSAYPDASAIAKAVADQIQAGHLLEFASTALSQVQGITAEQSKAIIQQNTAVFERVPQSENVRLLAATDPNAAAFALAGIPPNVSLSNIVSLLNLYHTRNVLEKLLAAQFKLSEGATHQLSVICGNLLTAHNANLTQELYGGGPATILQGIVAKFVPLVVLFKDKVWDESNLTFMASNPAVFDITTPLFAGVNPPPISFNTVLKVAAYTRLVGVRDQGFTSEEDRPDPLAVQAVLTQGFAQDATLAKALRVVPSQLGKVKAYLSLNNAKPFEGLRKLEQAISLTGLLGLSGAALPLLVPTAANAPDEYNQLTDAAVALLAVLRGKYSDEQKFVQVIEPYEDILRSRKRDGLVEYVIRSMNRGFATPSDLYQFFLIDTQIEGCARTARLVAANGSLQLYVQRVLMNIERSGPDGPNEFNVVKTLANLQSRPLERIQAEWPWRSAYRVWEANRKVSLNPESYLEPGLRDDKTPLFTELESTLLQQRINEESATNAYAHYLEGFEEVASLKIAGAFHQIYDNAKTDRLHLFGATADDPPIHYYRTIDNVRFSYEGKRKSYTPWQKLNVQIPVRDVSPVIFEGRLLICWLQITSMATNKVEKGESRFVGYNHRFAFHYSEKRANGTWSPPQKLAAFNNDNLPFERLDDPLEEPIQADLQKEIKSSELGAALAQANSSETQFGLMPIMDPNNPAGFKKVTYTDSGGATRTEYVYNLIRLAPNPNNGGLTPRYDTTQHKHVEPVDGYTLRTPEWTRVHAEVQGNQLFVTGMDTNNLFAPYKERSPFVGLVDLFERTVQGNYSQGPPITVPGSNNRDWSWLELSGSKCLRAEVPGTEFGKSVLFPSTMVLLNLSSAATSAAGVARSDILGDLSREYTNAVVVNKAFAGGQTKVAPDAIVDFRDDLVMFLLLDGLMAPAHDKIAAQALAGTSMERLGTTVRRQLRRQLFLEGLGGLLSFRYQNSLTEMDAPISSPSPSLLAPQNMSAFSFDGPFGVYFQEIFFYIPFLIADNLNSQQRFSAAQRWYHYIFDPTSSDTGPNRVWQYRKFKEELLDPDALRKALTDSLALEAYRQDPFNPYAIARLRPGSYQKAIVMKYFDNLLDWGDTLFAEFTMESLNEATMLYALAADILGPRPHDVGDCGEASASPLTYVEVSKALNETSDFLIELEHFTAVPILTVTATLAGESLVGSLAGFADASAINRMPMTAETINVARAQQDAGGLVGLMDFGGANGNRSSWRTTGGTDLRTAPSYGTGQGAATDQPPVRGVDDPNGGARILVGGDPINPPGGGFSLGGDSSIPTLGGLLPYDYTIPEKGIVKPGTVQPSSQQPFGGSAFPPSEVANAVALKEPVFCIPSNPDLLAYWDRVEDRLYKIRNCMDITGARRQPSLYAPELDPRQLVKDKAAGLPLDDVLNGVTGDVPPYRFTFLVDRAKQYASTVQSFGSALLSALEKKDAEQLTRLRAVQEQNILKLRTRVQDLEIEAAEDTLAGLERQRESVELRQAFYETVLQNGLIPWERTQQVSRHIATSLHSEEAILGVLTGVLGLLPQFGAPTAMKYGGAELNRGAAGFRDAMIALAQVAEVVSASAGLEATFQRRDEDWRQQKKLADKELENVKKQIAAATARIASARRSLEVHNKSVEQAEEVFRFYQDKFSSYGLYSLLSAQLQRSYREAYNAAFSVAKMTEQAYRYEREYDSARALSNSYWSQDQAGLLAGERLLLDLQNLERRYLETNYRALEVEQSFSLTQVDPSALVALREKGTCTFAIPEALFDVVYPGQYRRRIKGVRLTIPCVVGPHTSVAATLRLTDSMIRDNTNLQDTQQPRRCSLRHTTVVAASTAQNDSGTFEFTFRDERYMPFEGLGAVETEWNLSLPNTFRAFDYRTISDVVLRISYTSEEDSTLRTGVEDLVNGAIKTYLKNPGISRIFSLRHEFPDVWNQLVRKPLNSAVTFEITPGHLPYFVSYLLSSRQQSLSASTITILLQTNAGAGNPSVEFNGNSVQNFQTDQPTGLLGKSTNTLPVVRTHTIKVLNAGALAPAAGQPGVIDESKLEDILLRVDLKLQ